MGPEEESVHINFCHFIWSRGFVLLWIQSLRQIERRSLLGYPTTSLSLLLSQSQPIFLTSNVSLIPFENFSCPQQRERKKRSMQFVPNGFVRV